MNCDEARQTLLDSLAGSIPVERDLALEDHIATCEGCRRFTALQRTLDERLAAAVPVATLSPAFRSSLREKLDDHTTSRWPEFLPDVAHVLGCALAIALLLLVLPQYSKTVLEAGAAFTAVTYFFQAVLRNSLTRVEPHV